MRHSRAEKKLHTRRTLLDGTLELLKVRGFAAVSLREVAKSAGLVPTAFYRHFESMEDLGTVLAEESVRALRDTFRQARREAGSDNPAKILRLMVDRVNEHANNFRFLVRERHGGSPQIRRAINNEMRMLTNDVVVELARNPATNHHTTEDLEIAAELIASSILNTIGMLVDTDHPTKADADAALNRALRQLDLVTSGLAHTRTMTTIIAEPAVSPSESSATTAAP
ncbi:TetR family transcriptional regulator [Mycobacteroides abscessus]|uniref:TetR family transcriptional regulator n=1 Tax=Mycobacteroides abscessus subsp. bolletii TaxID=319705 RepID=A0A9Q7SCK8_9MYCO|nr:TetR family transcriptional regulator [Mycobacteroides abscessus]AMU20522.1 TetR family transcriptional regulator [Mycobacteroides abscessus]ANN98478.1 TetR family transcriptional regulator [Mycobacteroides abscessus]EHM22483.1 TetR family transcriptional regulator [Mycobacteroides abscessus subsp. bolletii BD]MBN7303545.1 TetR family transcriptional regulator [Mycobacteroides abscessus subsp. bolletii]MDO2968352.1 TetR family transcriptional regulator [Mycobacteroides abscessus subsp. boll